MLCTRTRSNGIIAIAIAFALAASNLAFAPQPAHAQPEANEVVIVQNMTPIGSAEEYDALLPSGYPSADKPLSAGNEGESTDEGATGETPLCGARSFAPSDAETMSSLKQQIAADEPRITTAEKTDYQVGDSKTFRAAGRPEGFTATAVAVGELFTLWVEDAESDMLPADLVQRLAGKIDPVLRKVTDAFGSTVRVDLDGDGKTAFVFHRFPPETEVLDGYFTSIDLYTPEQLTAADLIEEASYTNAMDVLHLNVLNRKSLEGVGEFDESLVPPMIAHEFQHLVNFAQTDGSSEAWLNEAFSQAAVAIAGYGSTQKTRAQNLAVMVNLSGRIPPFVYEGSFVPDASLGAGGTAVYAHGYLFSRYLANQTRGLPGGGDSVYRSVFDAMRDERGLGQCTSESLMAALDNIGYAGVGDDCAVASLDDLALGYATALFLREETGPHSLVNRAGSNPSIVDGLEVPLLSVPEPSKSLQGGGSATIASLAASGAPGANAGSGTQTTFATSSLPVSYKIAANPSSGPVKPGSQIALSSPQLASLPGAHYEVATLTTYEQILNLSAPFLPLEDPLLFEPGVLAYAVRIASDRGTTPHTVFGFYETAEPDEGEGDQGDDPPGGDRPSDDAGDEPSGGDRPSEGSPSGDGAQHPDSAPDDDGTDGARVRQMPTKALATTGDGEVPTAALALTAAASLCCMALARCAKRRSVGSPAR